MMDLSELHTPTKPTIQGMVVAFVRGVADEETLFYLASCLRDVCTHVFDTIMQYIPEKETLYLSCLSRSRSLCLLDILEDRTMNSFKQLGNGLGQTGLFTEWLWRFQEYGYPSDPDSALSRSELQQQVQRELDQGILPCMVVDQLASADSAQR